MTLFMIFPQELPGPGRYSAAERRALLTSSFQDLIREEGLVWTRESLYYIDKGIPEMGCFRRQSRLLDKARESDGRAGGSQELLCPPPFICLASLKLAISRPFKKIIEKG